ncbi:MAG TPA: ABA4-like family protein [Phnomibacter sp.]|nr:ABA4-like family protein [Phnomibacter sp.]
MQYETIFSLANGLALVSWLYLAIFTFRPATSKILIGVSISLLCLTYSILVFQVLKPGSFSQFNSLEGITSLLSVPGAALVGWVHYLAFDLMVGVWISLNAAKYGIRQITLLPCFLGTFMLGPAGLLLYLLVRWAVSRQYFADNN